MLPLSAQAVPIRPGYIASLTVPAWMNNVPRSSPWARNLSGGAHPQFRGGFDPGMAVFAPRTLKGTGCDCGPTAGCGCNTGLNGLGQNVSLDQLIANAFGWLGGAVQSNLPASAAVPPGYGSAGAIGTQLLQWAPYIIGGIIVYKLVK